MPVKYWLSALVSFVKSHRIASAVILFVLVWVGYAVGGKLSNGSAEVRYVLGSVTRGTLVATVSASGQVTASDTVEVKPKVSGDVSWVGVVAGDTVRSGQALAYLDATDAKQAVADAEQSLAQARLEFQKDEAQAPIDYQKALESLDDAKADLATEYADAFGTLTTTYLALPAVMTGAESILYGYTLSPTKSQWNLDVLKNIFNDTNDDRVLVNALAERSDTDTKAAREKYDASLLDYKKLTRYSNESEIESFLAESVDAVTALAQSLQSVANFLDTVVDVADKRSITLNANVATMQTNARSHLSSANSNLNTLLAQERAIGDAKRAILNNQRTISLLLVGNPDGNNPLSLQSARNNLANQERELAELKANLADYAIIAPFSGTLSSVNMKRYDSVTTGTTVATLITNQRIAELSLNEVDAAKVSVGDKVTLTFDALEDVTLTGTVSEVDAVGNVSQGVVSYAINIAFDTQDERVKPGMTVNAAIVIDVRTDALMVPASAVKTQNGVSYVQVLEGVAADAAATSRGVVSAVAPTMVPVAVGISDDVSTEVLSGLTEGQTIVVRTSTSGATTQATQSGPSIFGGGGGGAVRMVR